MQGVEKFYKRHPHLNSIRERFKQIKVPGLDGMTLVDLLEMYAIGILKGALTSRAGSIAFSFFMAVFPFTLFLLTLIPYVPIDDFHDYLFTSLQTIMPANTFSAVENTINDILNIRQGGLLSVGFVMAVIFATNGVNSVISGLTYSYHDLELRSIVNQYLVSISLTFILGILFLLGIGIIILAEVLLEDITFGNMMQSYVPYLIQVGRYAILTLILFFSISIIFYYGPKNTYHWKFISPGAFLTTVLVIVSTYLFGLYISNFGQYNKLYGSIGTLLVIMLWIYINSILLLIGFDLNASIWNLKQKRDTRELI